MGLIRGYLLENNIELAKKDLLRLERVASPLTSGDGLQVRRHITIQANLSIEMARVYIRESQFEQANKILNSVLNTVIANKHRQQLTAMEKRALYKAYYYIAVTDEQLGSHNSASNNFKKMLMILQDESLLRPNILILKYHALIKTAQINEANRLKQKLIDRGVASQHFI